MIDKADYEIPLLDEAIERAEKFFESGTISGPYYAALIEAAKRYRGLLELTIEDFSIRNIIDTIIDICAEDDQDLEICSDAVLDICAEPAPVVLNEKDIPY